VGCSWGVVPWICLSGCRQHGLGMGTRPACVVHASKEHVCRRHPSLIAMRRMVLASVEK
jgi:hypothetical protein